MLGKSVIHFLEYSLTMMLAANPDSPGAVHLPDKSSLWDLPWAGLGTPHLTIKRLTQQSLSKGKESVHRPKSSSKLGILAFRMHNPTVNRPEAPLRNIIIYTTLVTHFLEFYFLSLAIPAMMSSIFTTREGSLRQTTTCRRVYALYGPWS